MSVRIERRLMSARHCSSPPPPPPRATHLGPTKGKRCVLPPPLPRGVETPLV